MFLLRGRALEEDDHDHHHDDDYHHDDDVHHDDHDDHDDDEDDHSPGRGHGHGHGGGPCVGDCVTKTRNIKIAMIVVVGFITLLASYLPWILRSKMGYRFIHAVNFLSAIAAGAIFGALLCHTFPLASGYFYEYLYHEYEDSPNSKIPNFPFAEMTIGAVFIFLYSIDRLIISRGFSNVDSGVHSHGIGDHCHDNETLPKKIDKKVVLTEDSKEVESIAVSESVGEVSEELVSKPTYFPRSRVIIFFFAITLHAIFDGLALGAEESLGDLTSIMIAVLSHKIFDGIAIGAPMYRANMSNMISAILLILCAFATPLGIGIGMAAQESVNEEQATLAKAVILSLSGGSFLFISLAELLPSAIADNRFVALKLLSFAVAFIILVILAAYV